MSGFFYSQQFIETVGGADAWKDLFEFVIQNMQAGAACLVFFKIVFFLFLYWPGNRPTYGQRKLSAYPGESELWLLKMNTFVQHI